MAAVISVNTLLIVRGDESIQAFPLPGGETGSAIARSDTGRVWVATSGAVRPFDPISGSLGEPALPLVPNTVVNGLMVSEAEGARAVWTFDGEGQLHHQTSDAPGFQLVFKVPPERLYGPRINRKAHFAPTERGGFAPVSRDMGLAIEYRPTARPGFTEELRGKSFSAMRTRPDAALLVADVTTGEIFERRDGLWHLLRFGATEILALAPISEEHLLYTTRTGNVGALPLSGARCPGHALGDWNAPLHWLRSGPASSCSAATRA